MKLNTNYSKLEENYLFTEIAVRTKRSFYFCFHICDVLVIVAYAVALILCLINLRLALLRIGRASCRERV